MNNIKTVCFIGAGTMGCYNSLIAALAGYKVIIYDITQENLDQVSTRQQEFSSVLMANDYFTPEQIQTGLNQIRCTLDLKLACKNADLVSESIFENLDVKRKVHNQLDQLCPPHTILTTNSSSLLVSEIEGAVDRGDKFAALHSHLLSPLVDIVAGPRTHPHTINTLKEYVQSLSSIPLVLKKENHGYVLNALLSPLLLAAMQLHVEKNIALSQIDRAWMFSTGAKMGPFGMIDMFGFDIVYDSFSHAQGEKNQAKDKLIPFLKSYIDQGKLGVKTKRGFYNYPNPQFNDNTFVYEEYETPRIFSFLMSAVTANALLLATNGIASTDDIDKAWTVGTFINTAPSTLINKMSIETLQNMLNKLLDMEIVMPENAVKIMDYFKTNIKPNISASKQLQEEI